MTPDFTGNLSFFNASICLSLHIYRSTYYDSQGRFVESGESFFTTRKKSTWQEKVLLLHLRRREAGIIIIIIIIVPPRMEYRYPVSLAHYVTQHNSAILLVQNSRRYYPRLSATQKLISPSLTRGLLLCRVRYSPRLNQISHKIQYTSRFR
jgi:hypothetical protein